LRGFLPFLFTSNPSKNTVTKKIENKIHPKSV